MTQLKNKRILITGASFIGTHLIRELLKKKPAQIRVVNLSKKHFSRLKEFSDIEYLDRDLRDGRLAQKSVAGIDIIFHLAADHGGRGYVSLKQGNTATNFLLDGSVFKAALDADVEKIFYASSGCVYPNFMQTDLDKNLYLKESDVRAPYDADNIYGWAKLMGELILKQYYRDYGFKSAVCRFFTVYGPLASESHAVMGTIAKAFVEQDPFLVWGNGKQIRNWTYVEDIVRGIILATEKVNDATPINLGTSERTTVDQMVSMTLDGMGFRPYKIKHIDMPTGPLNRVADITLAKKLLAWEPRIPFADGLLKSIRWYTGEKNKEDVRRHIRKLLMHD